MVARLRGASPTSLLAQAMSLMIATILLTGFGPYPGAPFNQTGALVAALFAALGIWLGQTLTRKKPAVIIKEVPAQAPVQTMGPFVADQTRVSQLGITPREMEILGLIAAGLSNREIAGRLFVSENTVKTHSSRLFDKLGAKRRTQAVKIGKTARLIP